MGSPYIPVTQRAQPPAEWRCTAYWWASHHGLSTTYGCLLELGLRAARAARWYGLAQAMVWEGSGPPGTVPGFWVHTWPAWVWEEAARAGIRCLPAPPQPPPPARYAHSGDPAWESADGDPEGYGDPGYREAGDYG